LISIDRDEFACWYQCTAGIHGKREDLRAVAWIAKEVGHGQVLYLASCRIDVVSVRFNEGIGVNLCDYAVKVDNKD